LKDCSAVKDGTPNWVASQLRTADYLGVTHAIFELLRDYQTQKYEPGQIILQQGEKTGRLYFLIEGEVAVLKDGVPFAKSSQPGAVFGEMAMLLNASHAATVRAEKPCTFHVVDNPREFLESSAAASLHVCEVLARRLDALNQYLVNVKRQFEGHQHLGMVDEVLQVLLHRNVTGRVRPKDSTVRQGELPN
jgi:CRP/FNR family transcriptional regulator, cyclic AMP receptor protein